MNNVTILHPNKEEKSFLDKQLIKFNITDSVISEMKTQYMPLTINGINDKQGFNAVHDARMIVKNKRISVDKKRKELNSDAKAFIEKVNGEAERITDLLIPIEDHLQSEETRIETEREILKKEAEEREYNRIQERINKIQAFGYAVDYYEMRTMTDIAFNDLLEEARIEHEKDLQAKEEAKKLAEAQAAQLLAERLELEALRQQQALIAKERKVFADTKFKERKGKLLSLSMTEGELNITYKNLLNIPRTKLFGMSDEEWETVYKNASDVISQLKENVFDAEHKTDKERIQAFQKTLSEVTFPAVTSEDAQTVIKSCRKTFEIMDEYILDWLKKLKG